MRNDSEANEFIKNFVVPLYRSPYNWGCGGWSPRGWRGSGCCGGGGSGCGGCGGCGGSMARFKSARCATGSHKTQRG